ncbi:hypothetical protein FQZ97_550240 [compost metagenome]
MKGIEAKVPVCSSFAKLNFGTISERDVLRKRFENEESPAIPGFLFGQLSFLKTRVFRNRPRTFTS